MNHTGANANMLTYIVYAKWLWAVTMIRALYSLGSVYESQSPFTYIAQSRNY